MEDVMLNRPRESVKNWKRWLLIGLVIVAAVFLATPLGFLTTLSGTAGLVFVYWGIRAVERSLSARSVDRTTIGSLDKHLGAVQIVGEAEPSDDSFRAPLTDTDCIAWRIEVKEETPSHPE